jgi:hypothetical protein
MRHIALSALLVATVAAANDSAVLVDFEAVREAKPVADGARVAALISGRVLRASKKACKGHGDATYVVTGGVDGAFTKVGEKERAYIVTLEPCVAPGPPVPADKTTGILKLENPGSQLVVMRGSTVMADVPVDENEIVVARDLDGDGLAEILLGHREELTGGMSARLVMVRDRKVQVIRDFGYVMTGCGWGEATHATITYKVGDHGLELATATKPHVCK